MICHHHQCIFIHIPKNAGQSIEHVFLKSLGLNWNSRMSLLMQENDNPQLGPPRLAHLKASDYVSYKYITQNQFDNYFKFTIVRNPWDRMVSLYKYLGFAHKYDFKSFLFKKFKPTLWDEMHWFVRPQYDYLFDAEGLSLVDFIGRFENLQNDFNHVCKQIGLPPTHVPHANQSKKKNNKISLQPVPLAKYLLTKVHPNLKQPIFKRYEDYYDSESSALIADLYQVDIEKFAYQFSAN